MLDRQSLIYSAVLHLMVVLAAVIGLPRLFEPKVLEDQPIAVQLVNIAPQTHATQTNRTPPVPDKKPDVAQTEPPKPEPPKPEPPPTPPPPPPPPPPPIPPPEPKPQPPKPEPPPPPPPAPKPPQPPQKKPDDASFDQLLKNLANKQPAPQQQNPGPQQKSSQPIAPLADQLSTSEMDVVRQQLESCWNIPAGARDAQDLTPEFRVTMAPDATVQSVQLLNSDRMSDPFFQAAAESARRAFFVPRCEPLKLPLDKYDQWHTFTVTFDPKDLT